MNPFPDTILVPTTANRLRVTENNEAFLQKLLELEVDASTFLIPEAEMLASNDAKIAHDDLIGQIKKLPAEIRDKIFPPLPEVIHLPPTTVTATADDDDDDSGMGGISMGMAMSPGLERQLERERKQQRRQSDGPGMSM